MIPSQCVLLNDEIENRRADEKKHCTTTVAYRRLGNLCFLFSYYSFQPIIPAASGSVDREFWCKIYHQYGGGVYKPGPFVTGWILTFFPYLNGNKRNEFLTLWQEEDPTQTGQVPAVPPPPRGVNADRFKGLAHYQFPPGIASAPFTWQNGIGPSSEVFPMHFYAGFMTISQDSTTMAVRPEIGWAVADDKNYEDAKTRSGRRR